MVNKKKKESGLEDPTGTLEENKRIFSFPFTGRERNDVVHGRLYRNLPPKEKHPLDEVVDVKEDVSEKARKEDLKRLFGSLHNLKAVEDKKKLPIEPEEKEDHSNWFLKKLRKIKR